MPNRSHLKKLVCDKPLIIPQLILNYYTNLDIDEVELAVILQLIKYKDCKNEAYPSIEKLQAVMTLGCEQIKVTIARLIEKRLLKIDHDSFGKSAYNFEPLWDRLLSIWEKEQLSNYSAVNNQMNSEKLRKVYSIFEKEFGRFLSPIESNKIVQWCEDEGFSTEVLLEALKRAVFQGVLSFKYIDSILQIWANHNIKTSKDIIDYEKNYNHKKLKNKRLPKEKLEQNTDKFSELYVT